MMYNNYYPSYAGGGYGNYQSSQFLSQQSASPQLKGRLVSSIDEARAAQIDFDGSLFIFPDIGNKKIYTKSINADGTTTLNTYGIINTPPPISSDNFITKEEFNKTIEELKVELMKNNTGGKPQMKF